MHTELAVEFNSQVLFNQRGKGSPRKPRTLRRGSGSAPPAPACPGLRSCGRLFSCACVSLGVLPVFVNFCEFGHELQIVVVFGRALPSLLCPPSCWESLPASSPGAQCAACFARSRGGFVSFSCPRLRTGFWEGTRAWKKQLNHEEVFFFSSFAAINREKYSDRRVTGENAR